METRVPVPMINVQPPEGQFLPSWCSKDMFVQAIVNYVKDGKQIPILLDSKTVDEKLSFLGLVSPETLVKNELVGPKVEAIVPMSLINKNGAATKKTKVVKEFKPTQKVNELVNKIEAELVKDEGLEREVVQVPIVINQSSKTSESIVTDQNLMSPQIPKIEIPLKQDPPKSKTALRKEKKAAKLQAVSTKVSELKTDDTVTSSALLVTSFKGVDFTGTVGKNDGLTFTLSYLSTFANTIATSKDFNDNPTLQKTFEDIVKVVGVLTVLGPKYAQ